METLHLIAGLGNPGRAYARTRHNAGFMAVEALGERWGATWRRESRFEARLARIDWSGRRVLLCQPQTFMNLSGRAVARLVQYYGIELTRLLLIVDDVDLPCGMVRLRARGRSGGHHGLESIAQHLGTHAYARLRVGIGRRDDAGTREITGYVLERFAAAEEAQLERVLERVVAQAECWLTEGVTAAMNRFNGSVEQSESEVSE
jgi:PTH1 family peptidyl-tRNA hydrolase